MLETRSNYEANRVVNNNTHIQNNAKDILPEKYGIDKRLVESAFNNMTASKKALKVV